MQQPRKFGENNINVTTNLPKYKANLTLEQFKTCVEKKLFFKMGSFTHKDDTCERAYKLLTQYEVDICRFIKDNTRLFVLLCLADIDTHYRIEAGQPYIPAFEIGSKLLFLCMYWDDTTQQPSSYSSYPYRNTTTFASHFIPEHIVKTDNRVEAGVYIIENHTQVQVGGLDESIKQTLEPYIATLIYQYGSYIEDIEKIIEDTLRLVSICTLSLSKQELIRYTTNLSQPFNATAFALTHNGSYSIGIPHDFPKADYQRVLEHEFGHILSYVVGGASLSFGMFKALGEVFEEGFTESLTTEPVSYPYPRAILHALSRRVTGLNMKLARVYFRKKSLFNFLQYIHHHTSSDVVVALLFGDATYQRFKNDGYKIAFIDPYQVLKTIDPTDEYVQVIEQFLACNQKILYGLSHDTNATNEHKQIEYDIKALYKNISYNITLCYHSDKPYYQELKAKIQTIYTLTQQRQMITINTLTQLKNNLIELDKMIP